MNFIKSLFTSLKQPTLELSEDFGGSVRTIIDKIESIGKMLNDDEYYELICQNSLNIIEANEIYIFLPIAFTHLLVPIKWPNEYIERQKSGKDVTKKFNTTASFVAIMEVAKEYVNHNPCKDTIRNIAGRSAEFSAINEFLLEGGKVEDIKATKTMVIR